MKKILKKLLEKYFYSFHAKNYQELEQLLENYDYISFDIFDTLIKRNIKNPTDIFDIIERKTKIKDFKSKRITAEMKANQKSDLEEITIEDIYKEMDVDKEIMNLEIELEKNFCTKNIPIYDLYKNLLKKHKTIFFTSDMYLPKKTVEDILKSNGYTEYQKLYLSSEEKVKKRSGNLFKKILKENNIPNNKLIHVGDSFIGDYLIPQKNKINSLLIKRDVNNLYFKSNNDSLDYNILSSFMNNNIHTKDPYEHFGYEILGPILYSFTSFIHKKVEEDRIQKLYFLARDAKIIMDVYKERYKEDIPIYYLNVSRKSVLNASLENLNNFEDILNKYKSILKETSKVKDLLNVLNLKNKYEFDLNKLIMNLTDEEKKEIFNKIKDELVKENKIQNEYLQEYLKQNDMNGNVGIVDIGWNATTQYYLKNLTQANMHGYYYGINKDNKYKEYNIKREGYLFNNNLFDENQVIIYLNGGLFEIMFLAPEGTTIGYKKENNKIIPVLGKEDYKESNIKIVKKIQNMAFKFVEDIQKNFILENLTKETYFENFKYLTANPTIRDIKLFKNIEFQNFDKRNLIDNKNLLYYLIHPKIFYKDFMNSYVKTMFMKNIFKIKLPYYKLLKKLYIKNKSL